MCLDCRIGWRLFLYVYGATSLAALLKIPSAGKVPSIQTVVTWILAIAQGSSRPDAVRDFEPSHLAELFQRFYGVPSIFYALRLIPLSGVLTDDIGDDFDEARWFKIFLD